MRFAHHRTNTRGSAIPSRSRRYIQNAGDIVEVVIVFVSHIILSGELVPTLSSEFVECHLRRKMVNWHHFKEAARTAHPIVATSRCCSLGVKNIDDSTSRECFVAELVRVRSQVRFPKSHDFGYLNLRRLYGAVKISLRRAYWDGCPLLRD